MVHDHAHNQIVLTLQNPNDLFVAPTPDPLNGRFRSMSGIDELMAQLRPRNDDGPRRVTIVLPADQVEDDLAARCKLALEHTCDLRIQDLELQEAHVVVLGQKELVFGAFVLIGCLLLTTLITALDWGVGIVPTFFLEGIGILGWIGLWRPIDTLLFDRWPLQRDEQVLRQIRRLELDIRPAP